MADRAAHGGADAIESTPSPVHFPGLEVIRALAAVMVVVHHVAFVAGARSGRVATPASVMDGGVAVFFVLSGFLLFRPFAAALLTGSRAQPAPAFWWRRVLRIFPAYWLALTVLWAAGNFRLGPEWWRYYLLLQPYSRTTAIGGIVPAWSLSTEIAFYLLVPVFAFAAGWTLQRLTGDTEVEGALARRTTVLLVSVVGLGAVGPLSRATAPQWAGENAGLAFQWLPTNLDLFATGMVLAVVSARAAVDPAWRRALHRAAGPAGLWWTVAALVFAAYAYGVGGVELEVGYAGWFWQRRQLAFAVFAGLLLVPAVFGDQGRGVVRAVWSWRPLVWVGTVSYGLYLWHLGVLERLVDSPPGRLPAWQGILPHPFGNAPFALLLVLTLAGGLGAAAASWYLLERPLQRFKGLLDSVARRG